MKKIHIAFLTVILHGMLFTIGLDAQEKKNEKKTWKERKAERQAMKATRKLELDSLEMIAFEKALLGINDSTFALEANMVFNKQGRSANVSPSTNFVQVNKNEVTVQLTFPFAVNGPNGIGGITLEGKLSAYELQQNKKGDITLRVKSFGSSLNADITIHIYRGSNRAEATVMASTLPYRVRYDGEIYHLKEASTFKGTPLF